VSQSFAQQKAATRHYTLGAPRSFTLVGDQVLFLRSSSGLDPQNALWRWADGVESILVDPRDLLVDAANLPAAERARRERMREQGGGITAYSTDEEGTRVVFALGGTLWSVNLASGEATSHEVKGPVIDPQLSPDGTQVAWSTGTSVELLSFANSQARTLRATSAANTQVGLADFIAGEELGRTRGFWWSPESRSLLIQETDESPVQTWWISDNANPATPPREVRYPQAGTANAIVRLFHVTLDGSSAEIEWDRTNFEYLVRVHWTKFGPALITLANRRQTQLTTFELNAAGLKEVAVAANSAFVEVIPGQPAWDGEGKLVTIEDFMEIDTRALCIEGTAISPRDIQILGLIGVSDDGYLVSATSNATNRGVAFVNKAGELSWLATDGVNASSAIADGLRLAIGTDLNSWNRHYELLRGNEVIHNFVSHAQKPELELNLHTISTGPHEVNTAVLFPTGHEHGCAKLPVLVRPYGGPHGAQVLNSSYNYAEDQWWADQGFVVIVADGRGTPARGPRWERAIHKDFVTAVLADQISALNDVAATWPGDVDLERVGISGWSFGGYLAALAVLKAPEHFHVAIAGAPVTRFDWYDTAYTERYLGLPTENPEAYASGNLLELAPQLSRPLMLIHGLVDDNVVVGHSLALSNALMAAGRPHTVLPLTGITHMASDPIVAENLLLLQLDYFKAHLS
jgi:dipeptidyl-peptidase-4